MTNYENMPPDGPAVTEMWADPVELSMNLDPACLRRTADMYNQLFLQEYETGPAVTGAEVYSARALRSGLSETARQDRMRYLAYKLAAILAERRQDS